MDIQTVLVVDNDPNYLQEFASFFFEKNVACRILSAPNGKSGIELAALENPDIIIMDWQMPVMNGLTAIKILKKDPRLKDIPIIVCTFDKITGEDLKEALEAGASDYIQKPVDKVACLARLNFHLKISKYIKLLKEQGAKINSDRENNNSRERKILQDVCDQMAEIIHLFYNERKRLLSKIDQLRHEKKGDNEIVECVINSLSQNNLIFKHYDLECKKYLSEDVFIKKLIRKHPALQPSEIELCLLLKGNLPSKEIASLTFRSTNTIKVARSKLRSKLGLQQQDNLFKYLISI